jgi:hypothetical protein
VRLTARWWWRLAVAAIFIAYAVLLFRNTSTVAGGPDESGYMNAARMFSTGTLRLEVTPLAKLGLDPSWLPVFTPLGFNSSGERWIVPAYPPGLPVHLLIAGYYVSPILALGCVLLTYVLARQLGLAQPYAIAAAAILAVTPQFILFALQVMSDVPATFWALLTVVLALESDRRPRLAFAAGVALAIGVCVRPASVLMVIPLVLAMKGRVPLLTRAAIGALPLAVALLWFQNAVYGSPFATGYGTAGQVISFEGFGTKLMFYSEWMARTLTPLIAPLGLLVIFARRVAAPHRALLVAWYLVFLLFYCTWGLFSEWWYTRFLLPATPAIIIATMLLVRDYSRHRAIAAVLIGVMIYVPWMFASKARVLRIDDYQSVYRGAMQWSAPLIPKDAMVVSGLFSGAFVLYQNRFTARWDNLDAERFEVVRGRAQWYALISEVEVDMAELRRRLPGNWTAVGTYRNVTLYRLDSMSRSEGRQASR